MAEIPTVPKEIPGLGPAVVFGNPDRGIAGTRFYLKPEAFKKYKDYTFDGKKLREFPMLDGQSASPEGVNSARLKMSTVPGENPDAQTSATAPTELRSNPVTGETIPMKNAWGVRITDSDGTNIDIPLEDLTTEKPAPRPRARRESNIHSATNPREELEQIRTGSADARTPEGQDNISESDDGITPDIITRGSTTPDDALPRTDVPQDNVSASDDGVTPDLLHANEPPVRTPPSPDVVPTPVAPDVPAPTAGSEPDTTHIAPPTPDRPGKNVVTVVGIQEAYTRRATDFAKESLEKSRNIVKKFFGERFEERYYQYFHRMLEAAQNPFARESISIAEQRARTRYTTEMDSRNALSRAARKTWDRIKEYTFGTTTLERYAVEEMHLMQEQGQIREQASFTTEMNAFVERFEQPFEASDTAIRQQLGERLEILDPANDQHKPLLDGIKGIIRAYRDGTIPDERVLNERLHSLYETTIAPSRQDLFDQAETYASSLSVVAKEMKSRREHGISLATLDAELETMQVRLGIGQMGEATEITPTSTHKWVERINKTAQMLEKRGIIHNAVINEYTVGTAVSAVLALKMIPQSAASMGARMWIGGGAGAVVTGAFAGRREFVRRTGEIRRIGAQKEAGVMTPDTAKNRQWYESFDFQLRSVKDLVDGMQSPISDSTGQMKQSITTEDLRKSVANLADAKARSALSQRQHDRFGLIILGAVGEQETNRTALADAMIRTEGNLKTYLAAHRSDQAVIDLLGPVTGTTTPEADVKTYLDTLTSTQTQILTEGNQILTNLADPTIQLALDPLSSYTPEVDIMRRRLGIIGKAQSRGKESGIDALLSEFKKQAAVESARAGIKTAGIGLALGAISNEITMDIKSGFGSGAISRLFMHGQETASAVPVIATHTESVANHQITFGNDMHIDTDGNLDITDTQGHIINNAIPHFQQHVTFDANGTMSLDQYALDRLHHAGITATIGHTDAAASSMMIERVPTESVTAPGSETIFDGNNVAHTPEWSIPQGSHLVTTGDHTYNLVTADGTTITGIHTDATGAITNYADIQNRLPAGWTIHDTANTIQHSVESGSADTSTRTIHVFTDWDNRGEWGWIEKQLQGQSMANHNADVNAIKNVWQSYENLNHGNNITFDRTIPGLENVHRSIPLVNGEVSANIMPNNSLIELPNSLFSNEHMAQMATWSEEAIGMYNKLMASNPEMTPMAALETIQQQNELMGLMLRIGHFAVPSLGQDNLSASELQFLSEQLNGVHTETVSSVLHSIAFTAQTTSESAQPIVENFFHVTAFAHEGGPEGFIPIIPFERRKGLEFIGPIRRMYDFPPNYYYGENPSLTMNQYQERMSPALLANTEAVLSQHTEVQRYLHSLSDQERAHIDHLKEQYHEPASDSVRAIITIPAHKEEINIYQTLEEYAKQKTKDNQPLNPDTYEIIVYDNHPSYMTADNTSGEVERFKQAHPEMHVIYLHEVYDVPTGQRPNIGRIRRDLTNFAFDRIKDRTTGGDVIMVSNDADALSIAPTYIADMIERFDGNKNLDAIAGDWDFPQEMYQKFPVLFASQRAWQFLDHIIRINENGRSPQTCGANTAVRASILAAIGSYNDRSSLGEDLELGWMIRSARNYNPDRIQYFRDMKIVTDPRRAIFKFLQNEGVVDRYNDFNSNDAVRNKSWEEMAEMGQEAYSQEKLEADLSKIYNSLYTWVKKKNPTGFERYFQSAMNWTGISYRIEDSTERGEDGTILKRIVITDDTYMQQGFRRHAATS